MNFDVKNRWDDRG